MSDLLISDWRLISITLDEIGPFRNGPETFSFLGDTPALEAADQPPGPSNFYMLIARNGRGKTTVLETIHGLFGLMASPVEGRFLGGGPSGRAQLDIRGTWTIGGRTTTVLLSLWTGADEHLVTWTDDRLEEEAQATAWARLGLSHDGGRAVASPDSNELGLILHRAVTEGAGHVPSELFGEGPDLPTVLMFPADRLLLTPPDRRAVERPDNWFYQPAHRFGVDGDTWNRSIDNLLIWFAWLGDGSLERALEFVTEHVFDGDKVLRPPSRRSLTSSVSTAYGQHSLEALSHGERALLQLYLRIIAHMTRNTIVLIDEVELHLHTRWTNKMFQGLKALLRSVPALSLIFTTHDRELIKLFDHPTPERGLVKGGFLITEDMD